MSIPDVMDEEFDDFRAGLPRMAMFPPTSLSEGTVPVFVHPTEPGGVPEGWQVCWHAVYPHAQPKVSLTGFETTVRGHAETEAPELEVFIVRRTAGGWAMLFHEINPAGRLETTLWAHVAPTMAGLHHAAVKSARIGPGSTGMLREIRDYIVFCYDMADPTEAAEATLVGLGAPVTVFPRVLGEQ